MALWVDFNRSPRIVWVDVATDDISLQTLINELRDIEDEPWAMTYPKVIDAAGKENLGGGVEVGITATLNNARLAFTPVYTPQETGTATSNNALGTTLTDTNATFITNGVTLGATIKNKDTGASCTVLSVSSETSLITTQLQGGSSTQWTLGDAYDLHNIVQKNVSGGNLVAIDSVGFDLDPIFPTAYTQVIRTSSSSATTQNQESLEFASFMGGVAFKPSNGFAGTSFPIGTREYPSNNFEDVHTIAEQRGLKDIFIMESLGVSNTDISMHTHRFVGDSPHHILTIDPTANVTGSAIFNIQVQGELDGLNTVERASLLNVTNLSGYCEKTAFKGDVTLNGNVLIVECYSQVAGSGYPSITTGAHEVQIRDWHGSVGIVGMTAGVHTIEMYGGQIHIDATSSGGTIYLRGDYSLPPDIDPASGTTIIDQTRSIKSDEIHEAHYNRRVHNSNANTITIYESDKVTPKKVFDTNQDLSDITPQ